MLCPFLLIWQYILLTLFYSTPQYLESFVRRGPSGYGVYCTERLCRVIANGERKELPCWIELQVGLVVMLMFFAPGGFLIAGLLLEAKYFHEQHTSAAGY